MPMPSEANEKASPPDQEPNPAPPVAPLATKRHSLAPSALMQTLRKDEAHCTASQPCPSLQVEDTPELAMPKMSDPNQKASPPDLKQGDANQKATPPDLKPSDANQKASPPDLKPGDANQKASPPPDTKPGDANQKPSTPDLKPIHDLPIASKLHSSAPSALMQTLHKLDTRCSASKPCPSLQVDDTPPWAMLKPRGGHQKASQSADLSTLPAMPIAPLATKLHVLASSALQTLQKDVGSWVVLVVPYKSSWDDISETFMHASQYFLNSEVVSFGIVTCTEKSAGYCHEVPTYSAVILMQTGKKRDVYSENVDEDAIFDFVQQIQDSADLELTEGQVLDLKDPNREQMWLVACLPPGHEDMKQEWLLVANKLRSLQAVRVGVLQYTRADAGFCANVDSPVARFYPLASGQHSRTFDLQTLKEAPFVLEWALENIDDSVKKLNWSSFAKRVLTLEMEPSSVFRPWLIYFHSPWCYNCYQNYPDFAIAGIRLNKYVDLGKVNCYEELDVCQHEHVETYPTVRLYYNGHTLSSIPIQDQDFSATVKLVKTHLEDFYGGFFDL